MKDLLNSFRGEVIKKVRYDLIILRHPVKNEIAQLFQIFRDLDSEVITVL